MPNAKHRRNDEAAVDAGPSPGTASCLSGMALSLEGSEAIQSALALPMPAGRVFMTEAVSDLSGDSSPCVTYPTRAFTTRAFTPRAIEPQDVIPR